MGLAKVSGHNTKICLGRHNNLLGNMKVVWKIRKGFPECMCNYTAFQNHIHISFSVITQKSFSEKVWNFIEITKTLLIGKRLKFRNELSFTKQTGAIWMHCCRYTVPLYMQDVPQVNFNLPHVNTCIKRKFPKITPENTIHCRNQRWSGFYSYLIQI